MKLLLILSAALLLTSCSTNKNLNSSASSNEITNMGYFEPLSYIQYIEKGNKATLSDSLSSVSRSKLDSILFVNKPTFRLSNKIVIDNDTVKARVENEVGYLARLLAQRKKSANVPLTKTIDSIMESNQQRFALMTVTTGFGRRKGNYRGQVAKGAAIGLLTLGMAIPTPIKSNLTIYAFIFDSEKNEVAYYKRSMPVEKEPTDPKILQKQLFNVFNGYLYKKK
jgi:hypothetical protein